MIWQLRLFLWLGLLVGTLSLSAGCGVTRSTDTTRTATEQLLISDAIDRAVQSVNLRPLTGQSVFLDDTKLSDTVDKNYYISTLRQQLLANGCELRDKKEEADFVVEARAGAIGTDRNDLLFGIPSMNVPQIPLVQPVPAAIPEIPFAKRKDQRGVAKIAVFAYHRATGTPVWQSGIVRQESSANDVWIFGAGPFQRGTIYEGTEFAGAELKKGDKNAPVPHRNPAVAVSKESLFNSPQSLAKLTPPAAPQAVVQAAHQEPVVAMAKPGGTPVGVSAPSTSPATTPAPAQTTAMPVPSPPPSPAPTPAKTAAATPPLATAPISAVGVVPTAVEPVSSVYGRIGDVSPLPQPRFNSPQ
ncbi:MAG TPA: DUF6655 family protein [Lacipirellulaceae bacterium]|nr:DUF6655 family protein [Lacipirellulaceae bacterium]